MELHGHVVLTQSLQLTLGSTLSAVHSVVLDKHRVTCIIQSRFMCAYSVMSDSLWLHGLYNLPGLAVSGILEWVVISYSRGSSWPKDQIHVSCNSCTGKQILYHWATWKAFTALKTSVFLCSPQPLATTELFTLSTVLPFLECLVIGIIKCVDFSY